MVVASDEVSAGRRGGSFLKHRVFRLGGTTVMLRVAAGVVLAGAVFAGIVVVAGVAPDPTWAQAAADPNPFVERLPALRTAPAPSWVRQGLRLTYYAAYAATGGGDIYVEDENGNWVQAGSGRRFRQEEISTSSGQGFTEVNLVLLDRATAVLDIRSFGLPVPNAPPRLAAYGGAVAFPGAGGDFWLNPRVLQSAVGLRGQGLRVLKMPYVIRGRQYRAIRFQSVTGSGSNSWVYDEDTGVLLHSSSSSSRAVQGPRPLGERLPPTSGLLSMSTLLNTRVVTLPWMSSPAPEWVARTGLLRYAGNVTVGIPGVGAGPVPIALTYARRAGGTTWARYVVTQVTGNVPGVPPDTQQFERALGPATIGGLWIAPAALRQLQRGQALDRDPATGMGISVGQVGPIAGVGDVVTVLEANGTVQLTYVYDRSSGMLVFINSREISPVNGTQIAVQLQLVQRQ